MNFKKMSGSGHNLAWFLLFMLTAGLEACKKTATGTYIDWYKVIGWIIIIIVAIVLIVLIVYLIILLLPEEIAILVVSFLEWLWFEVIWPFIVWLFRDVIWKFLVWLFRDIIWKYLKWIWVAVGGNALWDWIKSGWDWLWSGGTSKPFYPPVVVACPSAPITLTSPPLSATESENDYPFGDSAATVSASAMASALASAKAAALDDLTRQMAAINCQGGCTTGNCVQVILSGPVYTTISTPTPTVTPHLKGLWGTYTATATVSAVMVIQCQCKT